MKKLFAILIYLMVLVACSGENGANGVDGVAGKDGRDGKDGANCSVVPQKDGNDFYVVCAKDTIGMLYNGIDGAKGDVGDKGAVGKNGKSGIVGDNGQKGLDGDDGADCELIADGDDFDVLCGGVKVGSLQNGDAGDVGSKGPVADNCEIESVNENGREGKKITCGAISKIVWNGIAGENAMGSVVCGITKYDASTHFCNGITLYEYCGGKVYEPASQFCSASTIYNLCNGKTYEPLTQFCSITNAITDKCGSSTYNTTTHFCYNSAVYALCNGKTYKPLTQFCSTTNVITDKCGSSTYNTTTHFCYNSAVYALCNERKYNPTSQGCASNAIYDNKSIWSNLNSSLTYSVFRDSRDNQVYKYIKIGNQTWMAENVNYKVSGSYCSNCALYGRLYTFTQAKSACPSGWKLPSRSDWNTLSNYVKGKNANVEKSLRSKKWSGSDIVGFSVIQPGNYFWTSEIYYPSGSMDMSIQWPYYRYVSNGSAASILEGTEGCDGCGVDYANYVRCLKK